MLCEVYSLGLTGISGYEVRAECDLSGVLERLSFLSFFCLSAPIFVCLFFLF